MADFTYVLNDPTTPDLVEPVDLPAKPAGMDFSVEGFVGPTATMWTLEHQAACCYYTVATGIATANKYLPQPLQKWAATQLLNVYPRAGQQLNAYYDRRALKFFYATDPVLKKTVYTVNSADVVAHELGHAILDAVRPDLYNTQAMEVWAFHEAFGDINALLNILQHDFALAHILKETNNDLRQSSTLTRLAEEMGTAIYNLTGGRMGHTTGVMRNAVNQFVYAEPQTLSRVAKDDQLSSEPHSFSRVFTGAWYDILVRIYETLLQTLPAIEAFRQARDVIGRYTMASLLIAPATIKFYDAVARAMLVADKANGYPYNTVMNEVFLARGILRETVRPMFEMNWEMFAANMTASDQVMSSNGAVDAVRTPDMQTLHLPTYMVNVLVPNDTLYEFDQGVCTNFITTSGGELVEHAHQCLEFLIEGGMIRGDGGMPFMIEDGTLVRSYFACGCCTANASNPQAPEYKKGYKPENNARPCCGGCNTEADASAPCAPALYVSTCLPPSTTVAPLLCNSNSTTICNRTNRTERTAVAEYGETTLVATNIETTVVSYTVPTNKTLYVQGFTACGDVDAEYRLYLNGSKKLVGRTSVGSLSITLDFLTGTQAVAEGQTVTVKVIVYAHDITDSNHNATILGYLR